MCFYTTYSSIDLPSNLIKKMNGGIRRLLKLLKRTGYTKAERKSICRGIRR